MQAHTGYSDQAPTKKPNYTWVWVLVGSFIICGCGGIIVLGAILFPVFAQARNRAQTAQCVSNVRQLTSASLMYAGDNDGRLPSGTGWMDSLEKYVGQGRVFRCPAIARPPRFLRSSPTGYGYAVNKTLESKTLASTGSTSSTIWVFETMDLRRNVSEDPKASPSPGRHGKGRSVGYADGHAQFVKTATSPTG